MRYVIVGTSGCGKTTFARQLAAATGAPHIELDALHWCANWTERPFDKFADSIRGATQGERWIIDGNYSQARHVFWPRATHVIWLNFSRRVVFTRVLRRTLRRGLLRERLWHNNRESLGRALFTRDSILVWSWTTFASNRAAYADLRSRPEFDHLDCIEFHRTTEATAYLARMAARATE